MERDVEQGYQQYQSIEHPLHKNNENHIQLNSLNVLNGPISESFPPTSTKNFQYRAEIHDILGQIDLREIDLSNDITFRSIKSKSDVKQLKELHSEWFPLQYGQTFYQNLLKGSGSESILAELDLSRIANTNLKYIVGAILYVKKSVNFQEIRFKFSNLLKGHQQIYIETIGVINELRQCGIASQFIQMIKRKAQMNEKIKYISLHMVTYNKSGERFYLKNGFCLFKKCSNYYMIEYQYYDSFLFICFLNLEDKPRSFTEIFSNCFPTLFRPQRQIQAQLQNY